VDRSPVRRAFGWAALAVAVALTAIFVPPLVMPSAPSVSPSASPSVTASAPAVFPAIERHAADPANLRNGARIIECPTCDGGSRVGYIGGPNTLAVRISGVETGGERTLTITYETAEPRTLHVAVDDGPAQTVRVTGAADWRIPATVSLRAHVPAGAGWVRFFNPAGSAPDINRLVIS
jgi:hypothetical protein